MRLLKSILAAGVCAAVLTSSAWAEDLAPGRKRGPRARRTPHVPQAAQGHPKLIALLKRADRDHDGSLSRAEIAGLVRFASKRQRHHAQQGRTARYGSDAAPGQRQRAKAAKRRAKEAKRRAKAARRRGGAKGHAKPQRGQRGQRGQRARPRQGAARRRLGDPRRAQVQRMATLFKRLDRDGDGQLSMREFAVGMRHAHKGSAFPGDGHAQVAKHPGPMGHSAAASKPGAARAAKIRAARMRAAKARAARMRAAKARAMKAHGAKAHGPKARGAKGRAAKAHGPKAHGVKGRGAAQRAKKPSAAHGATARRARAQGAAILWRLRQADVDQDGRLTRREAPGLLKAHFGKFDRDGDGVLTPPEVRRAVQLLQQKRGGADEKQAQGRKAKEAKARAQARAKAKKQRARKKKEE